MKKLFSFTLVSLLLLVNFIPVAAQTTTQLINIHPMSSEVRSALEDWLASSAPVDAPFYSETYIEKSSYDFFVSLVALNISSSDETWHFTEKNGEPAKVLWMGSVKVHVDGTVEELFQRESSGGVQSSPRHAGGGAYVYFPFDAGTFVVYGPRGVHGSGDYGTSGLVAVDLVSGDDLGANAASDAVYASDTGTVDYVCNDGTTVAVRTHNASTEDYFIYAHLLNNDSLSMSHEFSQSDLIGTVKHGSFDDSCGWADQASNHWHNHWMFHPASGKFQAENCTLTVSTQKWDCGGQTVNIGGTLYGGGGAGSGQDDPSGNTGTIMRDPTFFDYFVAGFTSIWDATIGKTLPEHTQSTFSFISTLFNAFKLGLRLAYAVVHYNINLFPLMMVLVAALSVKLVFFIIWFIAFLLRTWKNLVPLLGA